MSKQTLEAWVQEAMNDGDPALGGEKDHPLSAIGLVHLAGGVTGLAKEVYGVRIGGSSGGKAWNARDLAAVLRKKAEHFCQDAQSVQWFSLYAFYGNDVHGAEHPFCVNVQTAHEGGFWSEGPDEKGQKMQSMRHLEMAQQQVYSQQQHLNHMFERTIMHLTSERVDTMRENREMFTIMKEMMMEKVTNNHEQRMKEMQYQRSTDMRDKLLKMLPPLANTITGRELFPQSTADTALVELIADNLTQEDVMKIGGVLKPELMGPLMNRLQEHLRKKREQEAAKQALANTNTGNPEEDAGGGQ